MTPVQWLALALTVTATHAAAAWWGFVRGVRHTSRRAYDAAYADGVAGTYRRPSSVDATVGPTRLRTVPEDGTEHRATIYRIL